MAIKISGILKDGMGRPIPKCTIELLCKKTSLTVVVETEARIGLDNTGSYNMQVEPGKYDVSLYIVGFPPKRAGEIQVYLDSRPGTLNDFLTMPGESDLTPELVAIFQQLRNEAQQAASEAKADKELADSILTDVIAVQTDVNEKQQQVNADAIEAGKSKTASAASAKAASEDAGKTAADVATVAGLKANTETAAQQAEISNVSANGHAGRAEAAADSVKTLTASANTLLPGTNATVQWNPDTNNLLVGVPSGLKGDKGDKGEQGIQGIQGIQGLQGIEGDVGPIGPPVTLSPLLTSISGLTTAANQLIYLTDKDATATTAISEFGRKFIAAKTLGVAREVIGAIPAWMPIACPMADVPAGYLKCNGAAFDKEMYPELAVGYPAGKLPDLRGEFIRGWDDGRSVDTGRELLSAQGDAIRNITGAFYGRTTSNPGSSGAIAFADNSLFRVTNRVGTVANDMTYGTGTYATDRIAFDASNTVPTASENRPRNIAFLYIVRAA